MLCKTLQLALAALIALGAGCTDDRKPAASGPPTPPMRAVERSANAGVVQMLKAQGVATRSQNGDDGPLVIMLGENHAEVQTQRALAELLTHMARRDQLDAILVEGTEGPVEFGGWASGLKTSERPERWRTMLDAGELAGWEHFSLLNPEVPVHGVESLIQKARYDAGVVRQLEIVQSSQLAQIGRAKALLGRGVRQAEAPGATTALAAYEKAVTQYEACWSAVFQSVKPIEEALTAHLDVLAKHQDILEAAQSAGSDLGKLLEKFGPERLATAMTEFKESDERTKQIQEDNDGSAAAQKRLAEAWQAVEDAFFIAANAVIAATPGSAVAKELSDFFLTEEKHSKAAQLSAAQALGPRDIAMTKRVKGFLRKNRRLSHVVLIVGSAHLEGLEEKLATAGVRFVSGKLPYCDAYTAPWERDAWARRSRSRSGSDGGRKEVTQLQDPVWRKALSERETLLDAVAGGQRKADIGGLADNGQLFEHTDGRQATLVSDRPLDLHAAPGAHVVARGSQSGGRFVTHDRRLAKSIVERESDGRIEVAYYYRTKDARKVIRKSGEVDARVFLETPLEGADGKRPEVLLLFGESDRVARGGARRSPFLDRVSGGGGGHGGPPRSRPWKSATPDGPRRPTVLVTHNVKRARDRIDVLLRQEPDRIGRPRFIDADAGGLAALADLPFTPTRGDHAHAMVLKVKNTADARAMIERAGRMRKLANKQIALITCGDAAKETDALVEQLLQHGVLSVWRPDVRLTPEAGRKLFDRVRAQSERAKPQRFLDGWIRDAVETWRTESPKDPDLKFFDVLPPSMVLDLRTGALGLA